MSNLTAGDMDNLKTLKLALKRNPSFGVGTDPKRDENLNLHDSMLRLEAEGLVIRRFESELGIWWQAKVGV